MPDTSLSVLIFIIVLSVFFAVVNGFNDAANAVAASIGSRALSPRKAIILAAIFNLVGALTGLAVAKTIGKGILIPEAISFPSVLAGLAAVVIWGTMATRLGLPVSITHSFVSGLAAAGVALVGIEAIKWSVLQRVILSVVTAPVLGFIGGLVLMIALLWIFRQSRLNIMRILFSRLQWLTTGFLAYSHGKNDGQMPIGVITMALVVYTGDIGLWDNIPIWVVLISALSISLGTATGGWRVIKTLGIRITKLTPIDGFVADFSAGAVIEAASTLGIPVSTTHCASSAVMGVGATKRLSAVRWGIARSIVLAWILTFPICGVLGYLFALLFRLFF